MNLEIFAFGFPQTSFSNLYNKNNACCRVHSTELRRLHKNRQLFWNMLPADAINKTAYEKRNLHALEKKFKISINVYCQQYNNKMILFYQFVFLYYYM